MAQKTGTQDLMARIGDTIASHPRLSAAAAFQMGVLLGQAMQSSGALSSSTLKGIGRKVAAAPGAIASSIPTFGLVESGDSRKPRARTATRRSASKRARAPGKRRKRAART